MYSDDFGDISLGTIDLMVLNNICVRLDICVYCVLRGMMSRAAFLADYNLN